MNQAEALYHLQQLDLSILRAKKRLQEIATALAGDQSVQAAQTALSQAEATLAPLKTRLRNLDLELQSTAQKAQATETHLYSGQIKIPKEMQEAQREVESLKRRHSTLEEQLLEMMVVVEDAESQVQQAQHALDKAMRASETQNAALIAEQAEVRAQGNDLLEKRKLALQHVTAESLRIYDAMRPRKGNQPVALMQGQSCSACGIEQTMAIEGQVRRGELATCLNCGRILAIV